MPTIARKHHHNNTYIVNQHHDSIYNKKTTKSVKIQQRHNNITFTNLQHL